MKILRSYTRSSRRTIVGKLRQCLLMPSGYLQKSCRNTGGGGLQSENLQ